MFRVLCALGALLSVMVVTHAAQAQPKACKKVDVSFACRNGGSGSATFNCRGGETEAQCCARIRKRAADPRRGFCTGRAGGLISFRCRCAGAGGGGDARRIERLAPLEERGRKDPHKGGNVEFEWKVEEGESKAAEPGLKSPEPRNRGAKRCPKVNYSFSCRREGGASGKAGCGRGETEAQCCARVARNARESCRRNGGVARFKCGCPGRPGGGHIDPLERRR